MWGYALYLAARAGLCTALLANNQVPRHTNIDFGSKPCWFESFLSQLTEGDEVVRYQVTKRNSVWSRDLAPFQSDHHARTSSNVAHNSPALLCRCLLAYSFEDRRPKHSEVSRYMYVPISQRSALVMTVTAGEASGCVESRTLS